MHLLLGVVVATFAASPAYCATLSFVIASATTSATDENEFLLALDSEDMTHFDSVTEGRSVSARASLQSEGYDRSAAAAGDIRTGVFSLAAGKGVGFGQASAVSGFVQEFTARGDGQVTMRMDLSGWWDTDIPGPVANNSFHILSYIDPRTPGIDGIGFGLNTFDPDFRSSGQVSQTFAYTMPVADGMTYTFAGGMDALFHDDLFFTGRVTGAVALDAVFAYSVSDGVRLEFADPEFLTAAIPLPAGGLLLVGALGVGFGLPAAKRAALAGLLRRKTPRQRFYPVQSGT